MFFKKHLTIYSLSPPLSYRAKEKAWASEDVHADIAT